MIFWLIMVWCWFFYGLFSAWKGNSAEVNFAAIMGLLCAILSTLEKYLG